MHQFLRIDEGSKLGCVVFFTDKRQQRQYGETAFSVLFGLIRKDAAYVFRKFCCPGAPAIIGVHFNFFPVLDRLKI
jgi:hypothetical protein